MQNIWASRRRKRNLVSRYLTIAIYNTTLVSDNKVELVRVLIAKSRLSWDQMRWKRKYFILSG